MGHIFNNVTFPVLLCLSLLMLMSCQSDDTLFKQVTAEQSGIDFVNEVIESDSTNILDYEYAYNGGGVAIADFNNDGSKDIFLVGNMVSNRLYLNNGDMKFQDVSMESRTSGARDKWYGGVSVVDINTDGWPDIYLSVTRSDNPELRKNELYINQKLNENGIPVFREEAAEYGLDIDAYSTHAGFFDYDRDGDLDMYLLVAAKKQNRNRRQRYRVTDKTIANRDRLYRNEWSDSLDHPVFTDVSKKSGIDKEGYGLGFNIVDINQDGWKDIYVSNDYISEDLFWVNNGDGTFTDRAGDFFKHTSFSGMGTDVQDLNNDGLADIITLDMAPEDNLRKQTMTSPNSYRNYFRKAFAGFQPQYTRNTLQLNRGMSVNGDESSSSHPAFSEIAYLAGIAFTDWSWGPLVADFNLDGYRDVIITNGIVKDKTNRDFVAFQDELGNVAPKSMLLDAIPELKIPNYAFKNNGDLTFTDVTESWGLQQPSYSTGAVWADLDNDGDLDVVINNINQETFLYENRVNQQKNDANNRWLKIDFKGTNRNPRGFGATASIHYSDGGYQVYEHTIYRGYLSSVQEGAHFGLGEINGIDSLIVSWPDGSRQMWKNVRTNQIVTADIKDGSAVIVPPHTPDISQQSSASLFADATDSRKIDYEHTDREYNDFKIQRLLPHKLSQYGPGLAVGDVDGNSTQDIIAGGSYGSEAAILIQQNDGSFVTQKLHDGTIGPAGQQEDQGVLLFDADSDGDLDLYTVSGSVENPLGSFAHQDRLYENDGKGNFKLLMSALPQLQVSGSAVKAADYDRDGDLDLFIGGRVAPGRYPEPVSSYVLRNDSENGRIKFTDVTDSVAPALLNIGMVTDALWTDFNNDGWQDLVITGEWMPITFLKNNMGAFEDVTEQAGTGRYTGWWNSIAAGDFDNDGDTDYIAGNLGLNSLYQASADKPVSIYARDFEGNGIYTAIPTIYLPDQDGTLQEFPAHGRDDLSSQLPAIKNQFPRYEDFGKAAVTDILTSDDLNSALIYQANELKSSYIENVGDGTFEIRPLPVEAQFAPVFGMIADDFDGDGNLDVILNGNEFGAEVQVGQYDASNGLLLSGNGDGTFTPKGIEESGVYIPGDGKALVKVHGADGQYLLAASQNNGPLKIFDSRQKIKVLPVEDTDVSAVMHYTNGKKRREEFYYGTSFLSASGRFLAVTSGMISVETTDTFGNQRTISIRELSGFRIAVPEPDK